MKVFWVLLLFYNVHAFSQTDVQDFFDLSSPEQWWVICHPFKAKKALIISKNALKITDSISKTNQLVNDINGGELDAFKHSFWMASLTRDIGKRSALKLGEAHEKGNYKAFKKKQQEDGSVPDKISSEMDLFNNKIGKEIAVENMALKKSALIEIIIEEINKGSMKIIKKDVFGNFLSCDGMIIPKDSLFGKWENSKCLVSSKKR